MSKTEDFKRHVRLEVVGGNYDAAQLDKGLQAAFDAGREFGRRDAERLTSHPALASVMGRPAQPAASDEPPFDQLVIDHLKRLTGATR